MRKLKSSLTSDEGNREEVSESSDTSDSNEEGEVDPSEDELTNVRFSEPETLQRTSIPEHRKEGQTGDSSSGTKNVKRTQHSSKRDKPPRSPKPGPSENKDEGKIKNEPKRPKRNISPIKLPDRTPTKSEDEMQPLSRLSSRGLIPDLREELNQRPPSSKPKIDSGAGPIQNRISCDFPPGHTDK